MVAPGNNHSEPPGVGVPMERVAAFCRTWSVKELSLFGSVLRGDFSPESDVDVLLVFEEGASPTLEASLDMHDELRAMFGREVDAVEKRLFKNPFRRHHILTTRRVVYAA